MASYRPPPRGSSRERREERRRDESSRPERNRHDNRSSSGRGRQDRPARGPSPVRSGVTKKPKTKKDRTNNPSSRIHSLKNLLGRDVLPMTVRQEKERELAALLLDQQKAALAQNARKNLQRYHLVRFVERKKAERTLKKLLKLRDDPRITSNDEKVKAKLEKSIHEAEVDLNYTKYVPLGEKYISLYVEEDKEKGSSKAPMNKQAYLVLDEEQRDELRNFADELSNVVRTAAGTKPPLWYDVEKYMAEDPEKLDALREGRLTGATGKKLDQELLALGGKEDAAMRSAAGKESKAQLPSWLADDGLIDPADLDSEDGDDDDEMGDGGFFEYYRD